MAITGQYSFDRSQDIDETLLEAEESANGEPLKFRVQPQLEIQREGRSKKKMFFAWRGVFWNLKCDTTEDARSLRDAMASFFLLVERQGPQVAKTLLDSARVSQG